MSIMFSRFVALIAVLAISFPTYADEDKTKVIKSFKAVATEYIASFKQDSRAWVMLSEITSNTPPFGVIESGYVNIWYGVLPEYGIDIQTTNSLMSPYTGKLEFKVTVYTSKRHPNKEEAAQDFTPVQTSGSNYRHIYAYQDGTWVLVTRLSDAGGQWGEARKP